MRKISIAFLVLLLEMPLMQAQMYHPLVDTTKLWTTLHFQIPGPSTSDYTKFEGDATIGSQTYKSVWVATNAAMTNWDVTGFIREDAQRKVFFVPVYESNEYLLYDFNAVVGDSLWLMGGVTPYIVDSTGTYALETGEQRKSMMLHLAGSSCTETWVEGIGSLTFGVMHSGFCGMVGDNPSMLCAWEKDTVKIHLGGYPDCFIITGNNELSNGTNNVSIYPNPAKDKITIISSKNIWEEFTVTIFTLSGEPVLQENFLNQSQYVMNVSTLAKGIYLVKIQTKDHIETQKLIVE